MIQIPVGGTNPSYQMVAIKQEIDGTEPEARPLKVRISLTPMMVVEEKLVANSSENLIVYKVYHICLKKSMDIWFVKSVEIE